MKITKIDKEFTTLNTVAEALEAPELSEFTENSRGGCLEQRGCAIWSTYPTPTQEQFFFAISRTKNKF